MTDALKPDAALATDPTTALVVAIVEQEIAAVAALHALLHPVATTRTDAEIEADFDNLPV